MNKKRIIAIVVLILLLSLIVFFSTSFKKEENLISTDKVDSFTECKNIQYNYKLHIPADWKVWTRGYGDVRLATCEEGLSSTFFGKDLYKSMFVNQINIIVMRAEDNPDYWKNGIFSLEDYLAQYPSERTIEETTLSGERAIWIWRNNGFKQLVSYHNNSIYEFTFYDVDNNVLDNFFNSFSFIR